MKLIGIHKPKRIFFIMLLLVLVDELQLRIARKEINSLTCIRQVSFFDSVHMSIFPFLEVISDGTLLGFPFVGNHIALC